MRFGDANTNERECHAILDRAIECGINFVDTADVYGPGGLSEVIIGNWFSQTGIRREIILATKFRFGRGASSESASATRPRILQDCEASLRRLRTDYIDLYQIHMQDIDTPEEETLRALDDLIRQGKIRHIGCSNYAAYRLIDSLWLSRAKGLPSYVTFQGQYNLIERSIEREHVPACKAHGIGIIAWRPLAAGILGRLYRRGQKPHRGTRNQREPEFSRRVSASRSRSVLRAADAVAGEIGATVAQVSLAWLLHKPGVSGVALGIRTIEQLADSIGATALVLTESQMMALDKASGFDAGYPYDMIQRVQGRW
jgi:aryl-alcohol dehydrogenase-like predicted oxidoreductase